MIKLVLYIFFLPFTIWAMEGLDLNKFFKQSRVYQARIIYLMVAISISYFVVNFLYDLFINVNIL